MKLVPALRLAPWLASALVAAVGGVLAAGQTANPSVDLSQGTAALEANQPRQALADFQQILAANPNHATANLLAATAAIELFEGKLAVQYAEKARQLDPGNWKIDATLVAAYAAAGMRPQRDRERAVLRQLHATGAPDARQATGFLVEMFPVTLAGQTTPVRVDAVEEFAPTGEFHTYFRFFVRGANGQRLWEIDVQSNDFDERSWAQEHPAQSAAGQRQFQITGHGDGSQEVDYRMLSGTPDYDTFRAVVVSILESHPLPLAQR